MKKSEKKKKKSSVNIMLITLVVSFVIGLLLSIATDNFVIMLPVVLIPLSASYLCSSLEKTKPYDEEEFESMVSFYEYFLHYSAMEQSYHSGLEKAIEKTPISHFREGIENEYENSSFTLDTFTYSHTWKEERVFQFFFKMAYSGEEVDRATLSRFDSLIKELREEKEEKVSFFEIPVTLILTAAFALILAACLLSVI